MLPILPFGSFPPLAQMQYANGTKIYRYEGNSGVCFSFSKCYQYGYENNIDTENINDILAFAQTSWEKLPVFETNTPVPISKNEAKEGYTLYIYITTSFGIRLKRFTNFCRFLHNWVDIDTNSLLSYRTLYSWITKQDEIRITTQQELDKYFKPES